MLPACRIYFLVTTFCLLFTETALADCGAFYGISSGSANFARTAFGTFAVRLGNSYGLISQGGCVAMRASDGHMDFVVNHTDQTTVPENAFLAAHVAFIYFDNPPASSTYLFRNEHGIGGWLVDKSHVKFQKFRTMPHQEFNADLNGEQKAFDKKYRDDTRRAFNDYVGSILPNGRHSTWDSRHTFDVMPTLIDPNSRVGVKTENYTISFVTRPSTSKRENENEVEFGINLRGAQCVLIRTSGSPNVAASFSSQYLLAVNGEPRCASLLSGFQGQSLGDAIFAFFFQTRR